MCKMKRVYQSMHAKQQHTIFLFAQLCIIPKKKCKETKLTIKTCSTCMQWISNFLIFEAYVDVCKAWCLENELADVYILKKMSMDNMSIIVNIKVVPQTKTLKSLWVLKTLQC